MKRKRKFAWENPAPSPTYNAVAFRRGLGQPVVILSPDLFSGDPERRVIQADRERHGRLA